MESVGSNDSLTVVRVCVWRVLGLCMESVGSNDSLTVDGVCVWRVWGQTTA